MKVKQLQEYFALGVISGFSATRVVMGTGWLLSITGKEAGQQWLLHTAIGEQRVFSSLDTLIRLVDEVTGKQVSIATLK